MAETNKLNKVRYDIGIYGRLPFIRTQIYLEERVGRGQIIGEEEVQLTIDVPVTEYALENSLIVRLIGNELIDERFLEIEGERNDIAQIIRELRKQEVEMKKVHVK